MKLRPPSSPRTASLFPYTTLFRSGRRRRQPRMAGLSLQPGVDRAVLVPDPEPCDRRLDAGGGERGRRAVHPLGSLRPRSEEHTSELQSLMRISYAVFCLKKKKVVERKVKIK